MSKRFTLESRVRLETLLRLPYYSGLVPIKHSKHLRKICEILSFNVSSIWREVIGKGFTYDNYDAYTAHSKALKSISNGNTHYKYSQEQKDLILSTFKSYAVDRDWSPNALLLRLKDELPV